MSGFGFLLCTAFLFGQLSPDQPIPEVNGDRLLHDVETGSTRIKGHASLRLGETLVRADELFYSPKDASAVATGQVIVVSGYTVLLADEVQVDTQSMAMTLKNAIILEKSGVSSEALQRAPTAQAVHDLGKTERTVQGQSIRKTGPREYEVDGVVVTPCNCKDGPTWQVKAVRAEVIPDDRAWLTWASVWMGPVPVFGFPKLYVPLSDRRTGFLFPKPSSSWLTAFQLEQPFFWAISRSYDLTLTPRYSRIFGPYPRTTATDGVWGPGLETEFRYYPAKDTRGFVVLDGFYDLLPQRSPLNDRQLVLPERDRGLRGSLLAQHRQDLHNGWQLNADVEVLSDGNILRDTVQDYLRRRRSYVRSSAVVSRTVGDIYAGLDIATFQDVQWGFGLFSKDTNAPNTPARLPELSFSVLPKLLADRFLLSFDTQLARWSPLDGRVSNGALDGGIRSPYLRLDLFPRLSAPLGIGRYAVITPYAAARQDTYLFELTGETKARVYPIAGVLLESEMSRAFQQETKAFRHVVTPSVGLQYIPKPWGFTPTNPMDAIDAAPPPQGATELIAQVQQRLLERNGESVIERARLDLGQGVDLQQRVPLDTFARLSFRAWRLDIAGTGRFNLQHKRVSQFSANARLNLPWNATVFTDYQTMINGGSDRLRRTWDLLVGTPLNTPDTALQTLLLSYAPTFIRVGGAVTLFKSVSASYSALISPTAIPTVSGTAMTHLPQQTVSVGVTPECKCWRLQADASLQPGQNINLAVIWSLSGVGDGNLRLF